MDTDISRFNGILNLKGYFSYLLRYYHLAVLVLLIIMIGGVFMFEYIPKKENKKKEVTLTDEFTPNLIKLTNRDNQDNYLILNNKESSQLHLLNQIRL